jgi:hypothetical protein
MVLPVNCKEEEIKLSGVILILWPSDYNIRTP